MAKGPVDLLAQSMGGVVAMLVTLRNPGRVRRLVLTATSGGVDVADLTRFDWRANYRREHPLGCDMDHRNARRPDCPAFTSVACPTLLLWGNADRSVLSLSASGC